MVAGDVPVYRSVRGLRRDLRPDDVRASAGRRGRSRPSGPRGHAVVVRMGAAVRRARRAASRGDARALRRTTQDVDRRRTGIYLFIQ